jgi:hypothetical protein
MAQNQIQLEDVVNDFMLMHGDDSYVNNVTITKARMYAKRGVRELGFDVSRVIKTELLPIDKNIATAPLPEDFVNWVRVGVIRNDGIFYTYAENTNLGQPMRVVDGNKIDAKEAPDRTAVQRAELLYDIDMNRVPRSFGGLYGLGGGRKSGEFRINLEQNRIELALYEDIDELAMEYVADQALSENPFVHPMLVDALDKYMYNELIKRSTIVPANEKLRADRDWKDALKLANSRMRAFRMDKALIVSRKNYRLSPKY